MASGLDLNETVDYKLTPEDTTVWKLGIIPSDLYSRILGETDGVVRMYKLVQVGVKGWENYNVSFGTTKEKLFGEEIDVIPMSTLRRVRANHISQLALQVIEVQQLSEEERKN